jgi:hypothetical protein
MVSTPCLSQGAFARLALIGALALGGGSLAYADDVCSLTLARARELAQDSDASVTEYSGDKAKKILDAINSTPPVSDWAADSIIAIDGADEGPFRVGLSVDGCVTRAFAVPREVWPDLVTTAIGDPS